VLLQQAMVQVESILNNSVFAGNTCSQCQASLAIAKFVALAAPEQGSDMAIFLCNALTTSSTCEATYGVDSLGPIVTQVLANADTGGFDGQVCDIRSHSA